MSKILKGILSWALALCLTVVFTASDAKAEPMMIADQGSFSAGGTVITTPEGNTLHGDHLYTFYQVPVNARKLPLIFWHGYGQFSKTWETTPDGREGFQNIFLRKGFTTYLIDQPRRGNAGKATVDHTIKATPDEQRWFNIFRVGVWPNYFQGVSFPKDKESLNQYFRQITPDTAPINYDINTDAVEALFEKTGDGILVTHSHSGGMGWLTVLKSSKIKAVVSYEPGSGFVFPEGEVPAEMHSSGGSLKGVAVAMDEFKKLTKIPIIIYYGDFIPAKPSESFGQDQWRIRLDMAKLFRDAVNKYGGDVTLVHLPEIGIKGNTHFPFSDLNNMEIAELMYKFLEEKKLN